MQARGCYAETEQDLRKQLQSVQRLNASWKDMWKYVTDERVRIPDLYKDTPHALRVLLSWPEQKALLGLEDLSNKEPTES